MPDGKTHDKISFYTTPVVGVLTYVITKDIKITAFILAAYIFASFLFNGDLDTHSKPFNRWWLFKIIWIPYQMMFTHRSVFTHGLIIGTVVRLLYLSIIPFIILWSKGNLDVITTLNMSTMLTMLIGLELGSAVHTISDYLS